MRKLLGPLVLLFALLGFAHAQAPSYSVCAVFTVNPGAQFTWTNPYSSTVRVSPATGTTWFFGASSYIIAANGQLTLTVPSTAAPGQYDISVIYVTNEGGNPCGAIPSTPHITVGGN